MLLGVYIRDQRKKTPNKGIITFNFYILYQTVYCKGEESNLEEKEDETTSK